VSWGRRHHDRGSRDLPCNRQHFRGLADQRELAPLRLVNDAAGDEGHDRYEDEDGEPSC